MYCMKCGAQNDDTARFCISCGAALATVEATRPPPPPPPVTARPRPARPAAPARQKRGFPRWLVTCGVLALVLLCLCGAVATGTYFWLGLHRTNQTAKIVPADTPLLISFSPDPRQAAHFRDVESLEAMAPVFGAVPGLRDTAEEAQSELLKEFDIDWQKDVLPWIGGEASLAMMDTEATGYRDTPPVILAVATRNEKKSDAFLQKVRQAMEREGAEFEEEVYRNTQVVYMAPDYEGAFAPAFATFNHLVVVGADREALHQAIDTAQNKDAPVLADREAYKAVLKELPANRLGYVYLDGETFLSDLQAEVDLPLEWEAVRGVGASFGLADDGVRFDYVVSYDLDLLTRDQRKAMQRPAHRLKTADLAPGVAVGYWTGQDLFASWKTSVANVEATADIEYFVEEIEYETGVHLVDDVLAQMTGEYALAVLPDPAGLWGDEAVPVGFLLFAEAEDPESLESNLDDLADYLAEEGGADLRRKEIDGVTFTLLEDPWAEWSLGYGFVDDVLVIGTSTGVLRAAVRGRDEPLSAEKTFQTAIEPLSAQASSYFFLDVQEGIRIAYRVMDEYDRKAFNRDLRPYLEPIRAISLGIESVDKDGVARGTLFLYTGEK